VAFATSVSPENETSIRSVHRSLETWSQVFVLEGDDGKPIWLVSGSAVSTALWDTHAAGREIHYLPDYDLPPANILNFREDPLTRRINCRRFLRSSDLTTIRDYFPGSVGARVLICGFILILFETQKAMQACMALGSVGSIGGQRPAYVLTHYKMTSDPIQSGYSVTTQPNDYMTNHGCLGLRVRLPGGQEAITTTTHAFVQCSTSSAPLRLRMAEWYLSIRTALTKFMPIKKFSAISAIAESRECGGNTSLGTKVWLAGTSHKVTTDVISLRGRLD
jgi:hypothetical protein